MGKTNFSGPITSGTVQDTTAVVANADGRIRNVGFVLCGASFPFDHNDFTVATDANKLAVTGSNGATTTSVTLVDATQNVPGIAADHGIEAASQITLTSSADDSPRTATIVGTDVGGNALTEDLTMADAGLVSSAGLYKTVTSISINSTGTVGTLEVGVVATGQIARQCRSTFNHYPLVQTSSTVDKNLANNIVIPAFSRIHSINVITSEVWNGAGFDLQIGSFANESDTIVHYDDYFAGDDTDNDIKAVGAFAPPLDLDQTLAQSLNCLNVSEGDTVGLEMDKVVTITASTDTALTTGESALYISWLQRVNNTN